MTAAIIGITAVLLAIVGMPLFLVFAGLAVALFIMAGIDTSAVIIEISRMAASPVLIAIPLFTFAGYLLAESGTPKRLIKLTRALVGSIKGGTAIGFICLRFFHLFFRRVRRNHYRVGRNSVPDAYKG